MTKLVPLSNSTKFALVDDTDYEHLMLHVWRMNNYGYIVTGGDRNTRLMHRILLDAKRGQVVDHENDIRYDNQRTNIRIVTVLQNTMRQRKRFAVTTSRYKGVSWHTQRGKWRACINLHGKQTHLGYYVNEDDAARSYDKAAIQYFGEFARLNFAPYEGGRE